MMRTLLRVTRDIQNPYHEAGHTSWEMQAVIRADTMLLARSDKGHRLIGCVYGIGREVLAESPIGVLVSNASEAVAPASIFDLIALHEAYHIDLARVLSNLMETGAVSVETMDRALETVMANLPTHSRLPRGSRRSM